MREFWHFFRDQTAPALALLVSAIVSVGGFILDTVHVIEWIAPYLIVGGAALFFLSVIWMLARFHALHNSEPDAATVSAAPLAKTKKSAAIAAPKTPDKIWNPSALYVGEISADVQQLTTNYYFEITVRLYNATGAAIHVYGQRGNIRFADDPSVDRQTLIDLPPPQYLQEKANTGDRPNLSEVTIVLGQRVDRQLAERIAKLIEGGGHPYFNLKKLDLIAESTNTPRVPPHGEATETARLPLWAAFTLSKNTGMVMTGRVVEAYIGGAIAVGEAH